MLTDSVKTALLWALGAALVAALGFAGWQFTVAAGARASLAQKQRDRAEERKTAALVALRLVEGKLAQQARHATTQQEITHDLELANQAAAAARREHADADERLRITNVQLSAARRELDARGDAAFCAAGGDRLGGFLDLLEEGGRLAAEARSVAAEGARLVRLRDAEVRALKAAQQNDRVLLLPANGTVRLPATAGATSSTR